MSVFKRYQGKQITPRDKNWSKGTWYVWKRLNGRIIHKAIPEARTKEQAEHAERYLLEAAFNRKYGLSGSAVSFEDFANGTYTRYVEQHNANIGAKKLYIKKLCEFFAKRTLDEITPQDCRDCQVWLKGREKSHSSVNRITSTLSRIFSLACEEGLIENNPMRHVKRLKEPKPRDPKLTQKQKDSLWLELEKDPLILRLATLATNLPIRRGQLLAIEPDHIDLENGWVHVKASKGQEGRAVHLNATATETLRVMLADGQIPFPLKDFRRRWAPKLVKAGINKEGGKRGENYTFHDLRHYLASTLVFRHGISLETVRQAFAHSDMSITRIYVDEDLEAVKSALNALDATNVQPTDKEAGLPN